MSLNRNCVKAVELNLLPLTGAKQGALGALFSEYLGVANEILSTLKSERPRSSTKLHHLTYARIRKMSKLPSQLVCAARQEVWAKRKHKISKFSRLPISYNVPRSGSLKTTRRGNLVLSACTLEGRLGLPVAQDGAWRRISQMLGDGWTFTEFKLLTLRMVRVTLKHEFKVAEPALNHVVLGVDVGVGTLAAVTVFKTGKIERQLYFGRDVWQVKRDLSLRRSKLQAHASKGSRRARRVLRKLRGYELNFDKTRCYQEAHRIVALAKQYNATIAMENLRGMNNARLSRKSNRKVKRMPYSMLRQAVQSVAWQNGVEVSLVSARYTSQRCSRCGAKGVRTESLFKCKCGFTANADRNASVNIAKLLWERVEHAHAPVACFAPPSPSGAAVNQPGLRHDGGRVLVRNQASHPERKPPFSNGGS